MPRRINGFDREWTLKQVTQFLDDTDFMFTELNNLWGELDAEQGFMSWDELQTTYGEELKEVQEKVSSACGLAEDLRAELSDLRKILK